MYVRHILVTRTVVYRLSESLESPPVPQSWSRGDVMCRCSEPHLVTIRNVLRGIASRVFLFQLILGACVAWGQDASTGALRGVVLDAQGAAITTADILAIRVETGLRYHSATDSAGRFALDLLPAGKYLARAGGEGKSPQISPG